MIKRPKVRECFAWARTGKCRRGDECIFAHQDAQPSIETQKLDKKRRRDAGSGGVETKSLKKERKLEAESAQKGLKSAKAELVSRKEPNSFRGSVCWHWKAGKCPYGDDRRFSHETEPDKKRANHYYRPKHN